MKNLKKSLALVLVLVLALGMVPLAAGASGPANMNVSDYQDFDAIEYKEAVDVLTALGVLQGDQGIFRPTDNITRSEAAKIVAYIVLGTGTADALLPASTGFDDVPASHWASPFVAYCVSKGIIAGYGDGNFGQNDNVTAVQMGKMLLMAVGYGINGEYEGPGWELAVIDRARQLGVEILTRTGEGVNYAEAASREEVAQYTFNALTIPPQVSWNSTINDYSSWSDIQQMQVRPNLGRATFDLIPVYTRDGYGFSGVEWTIEGTRWNITGYYTRDRILETSTNGTPIDVTSANSRSLTTRGRAGYVADLGRVWIDTTLATSFWSTTYNTGYWFNWNVNTIPMYVNGRWVPVASGTSFSPSPEQRNWNEYFSIGEQSELTREEALMLAAISGVIVHLADESPYDGRVSRIVIIAPTVHEAAREPIVASNGNVTIPGIFEKSLQFRQTATNQGIYQFGTGSQANRVTIATPTGAQLNRTVIDTLPHEVEYPEGIVQGDILLVHEKVEDGISVTVVEKADAVRGQMTTARTASPGANITFDGRTFSESGLTPGALFNLAPTTGDPMLFVFPDYELFAVTASTADGNFNQDAILYLDHNGGVVVAKLDDPGLPNIGLVLQYGGSGSGIVTGRQVRLVTVDGSVGVYNVLPSPGMTVGATNARLDALFGVTTPGVGNTSNVIELLEYRLVSDNEVSFLWPQDYVNGTENRSQSVASYAARVPTITIGGVSYQISGDTAVYYYNWGTSGSTADFTGRNTTALPNNVRSYTSPTDNLIFVGYGPAAASQDWSTTDGASGVRFTVFTDRQGSPTSILSAIAINRENTRAGSETYAFVTNLGVFDTDATVTPRQFEYQVWMDGVDGHRIRSTSATHFGPGGSPLGLVSYIPNPVTGLVAQSPAIAAGPTTSAIAVGTDRVTIPFVPKHDTIGITPQQMADREVLMARSAYAGDASTSAINWARIVPATSAIAVSGSFNVNSSTKWYMVQTVGTTTTVMPVAFGPNITLAHEGLAYAIRGVQPAVGGGPETPVAAVYFQVRTDVDTPVLPIADNAFPPNVGDSVTGATATWTSALPEFVGSTYSLEISIHSGTPGDVALDLDLNISGGGSPAPSVAVSPSIVTLDSSGEATVTFTISGITADITGVAVTGEFLTPIRAATLSGGIASVSSGGGGDNSLSTPSSAGSGFTPTGTTGWSVTGDTNTNGDIDSTEVIIYTVELTATSGNTFYGFTSSMIGNELDVDPPGGAVITLSGPPDAADDYATITITVTYTGTA